jgi:hypothetical protein
MDKIILYLTLNLAVFSQRPLIALVHATTITYYALEILYNKYNGISYPNEMDNAYDNLNAYMIFDLFYLFTEKQFRFDMMFHHLFTMGVKYILNLMNLQLLLFFRMKYQPFSYKQES